MRVARVALILTIVMSAERASAYEMITGYQIGAQQSVGTTVSNNQSLFVQPLTMGMAPGTPTSGASRLEGVQFITNANANATFDLLTPELDHALVLTTNFGQILPVDVPANAALTLSSPLTTFLASAQYLARIEQPLWGVAFAAGYSFSSNGQLSAAANGGVQGTTAAPAPLAGTQVGAFTINALSHMVNGRGELQLTRARWDLRFITTYQFQSNGFFALAPGTIGAMMAPNVPVTTNLGAFVRATTHVITPSLIYRARVGTRGNLTLGETSVYTIPVASNSIPPTAFARTLVNTGSLAYRYNYSLDRSVGVRGTTTFGARVPTDPVTQFFGTTGPLKADVLVYSARLTYSDLLPYNIRFTAELGAGQPWIFQPPLGVPIPFNAVFDPIRGDWTPVLLVQGQRYFDPFTLNLALTRDVTVGAFGASAVVVNAASLTLTYLVPWRERPSTLVLGMNANQQRGLGTDLYGPGTPAGVPLFRAAATNRGLGASALFTVRLFSQNDFNIDGTGAYNVTWFDPDPDRSQPNPAGGLGLPSFTTHAVLFTLRGSYGRGTLQRSGLSGRDSSELGAFSADPRNGSPLTSSRLIQQGAPLLDNTRGLRPGLPPPDQSVQDYERARQQADVQQQSKLRQEVIQGQGTVVDDERAAEEKAEQEREQRQKKRTRKFSDAPIELAPAPKEPSPTSPPPSPPPTSTTSPSSEHTPPAERSKPEKAKPERREKKRGKKKEREDKGAELKFD
jgi:hypothetical protein